MRVISFFVEINRVRHDLFSPSNFLLSLPAQNGQIVKLTEKIYAPVKEYPKVTDGYESFMMLRRAYAKLRQIKRNHSTCDMLPTGTLLVETIEHCQPRRQKNSKRSSCYKCH